MCFIDKMQNFWINIGLVSALLIGVSYSSAVDPVRCCFCMAVRVFMFVCVMCI